MNFHVRRQIFAVKHFDEVGDRRLSVSDENCRVKIVLPVIDMVLLQLNLRFEGLRKFDISSDFTRQLLCIRDQLIPQKIKSIKELTLYIIKNNLCTTFFDVLSACIIYLTLPVTVASAERSFSKLKLIKNYLRNNMSQDRLSNIAVLNIEKDVAAKIKLDHVINTFANSKARK
ncbi:zinc finger MYM-type protein 1-like, partial [Aphis craccivora]